MTQLLLQLQRVLASTDSTATANSTAAAITAVIMAEQYMTLH
jgi:hypothetical protein